MNWFAIVEGRLVCIGNCKDWDAAYQVACETIGECEWAWLADETDVQQWANCLKETQR